MMKLKYIGETLGVTGLTNGKIYECIAEEGPFIESLMTVMKIIYIPKPIQHHLMVHLRAENGKILAFGIMINMIK